MASNTDIPHGSATGSAAAKKLLPLAFSLLAASVLGTPLFCQGVPDNLLVSATTPPPYVANLTITTDTVNPFVVNPGANVIFQAGTRITLQTGFHAMSGSNFLAQIASPGATTISGYVTVQGVCPLSMATVTVSGGSPPTTTDPTGFYSFTLPATLSYTITPSMVGYSFTPSSLTFSSSTASANFSANGPAIPSREYIRLGGRVIAIANCGSK
jgi:hypothetical protein